MWIAMQKAAQKISKDRPEPNLVNVTDHNVWHSFDLVAPNCRAFHIECVSGFAIQLCDLFAFRSERQNNPFQLAKTGMTRSDHCFANSSLMT
jgi:hypothetical protein